MIDTKQTEKKIEKIEKRGFTNLESCGIIIIETKNKSNKQEVTVMTNLQNVQEVAMSLGNDLVRINAEIKKVQSIKCRLKKQKGQKDYDIKMTEVLQREEILKEARNLVDPKETPVTRYTQEDVDRLDFDETIKAIKSIQSKKALSRWLTTEEGDNDEFRNACKIEEMLLEHKKSVQPVDDAYIRKTDLVTVMNAIEEAGEVDTARVLEMLRGLL